jgi:hypothetical protein
VAEAKLPAKGFIASRVNHAYVIAYDTDAEDSVFLRTSAVPRLEKVLEEEWEEHWPMPDTTEALTEFMRQYGWERISTLQARPALEGYLKLVCDELLDPEVNKEIIRDPSVAIQFVRAVKNFMMDVEEIE